jgi:type VI secretion system protein ImpK
MAQEEDPFGLHDASDRTVVIRPQPGGRRPPSRVPPQVWPAGPPPPVPAAGSPLEALAVPLLALAPRLRSPTPPADPETLRQRILDELHRFREQAAAAGVEPQQAEQAAWALAALLDDIVLDTPWGRRSVWGGRSLVGTVWREVDAGERFFERLAIMQRSPGRHAAVLGIFHRCLAMGFAGRYRVRTEPGTTLEDTRRGLAALLASLEGPQERSLSPHWQGLKLPARPPAALVPFWVVCVAALGLLLLVATGFRFRLADYADDLTPLVAAAPPARTPQVPAVPDAAAASIAPPAIPLPNPSGLDRFLAPEIAAGLAAVEETGLSARIRLTVPDLFAPARAELNPAYEGLVRRIGDALRARPGRVQVTGHTDNVPLKKSPRFPSNHELSEARAESVAWLLAERLGGTARLAVAGRAEQEPIASNATPQGRAANRRVEILLVKAAGGA